MENSSVLNDLIFQIFDWSSEDVNLGDDEEEIYRFRINLHGRTQNNETVYVRVNDYTPYFFVEIPQEWRQMQIQIFIRYLQKKVYYKHKDSLLTYHTTEKNKFYGFTNCTKYKFIRFVFNSYRGFCAYRRLFQNYIYDTRLGEKGKKYRLFESNIEPMLRCMHIQNIDACGWVKIKKENISYFKKNKEPTWDNINTSVNWKSLEKYENQSILPLVIASYDIECTSGDGSFPQAYRLTDKVIQIGTTFSRYGSDNCFYKHIITLGSCDKIDGIDVESYETEPEVLLAWTKLIQRTNPDVLTGYNIFGFDYQYLHDRSKKFGISTEFSKLGRTKYVSSKLIEKQLSSSALGNNFLKYYAMSGRIQIDLMKVVQKDYSLGSYKLDNVASHFIRESITHITVNNIINKKEKNKIKEQVTILETPSTFGLNPNQFIKIYNNDSLTDNQYMDGRKFKILKLTKTSIKVAGRIDKNKVGLGKINYKIYWCQAKDDVSPQDIFKLQEGSSADRAIIAKYCIQDCELVSKLIAKLQIITNNIGMANVCSIPLSYLFLRGQGVKIFSLVAKECRKRNYVIPVIAKKNLEDMDKVPDKKKFYFEVEDSDEEEGETKFEGANVLVPKVGVHYTPVPVLDYASLYPSSMIERNLSHELYITNKLYLQLLNDKFIKVIDSDKIIDLLNFEDVINMIPQTHKKYKLLISKQRLKILLKKNEITIQQIVNDVDIVNSLKSIGFKRKYLNDTYVNLLNNKINSIQKYSDILDDKYKGSVFNNLADYTYNTVKVKKIDEENLKKNMKAYTYDFSISNLKQRPAQDTEYSKIDIDIDINNNKDDNYDEFVSFGHPNSSDNKSNNTEYNMYTFAKHKNGQLGIIPNILSDLLSARKKTKKLMKNEEDPFKKSILDGLQQAYKVTANSLYGQTGALTSQICCIPIAASTTATGRELLHLARLFTEHIFYTVCRAVMDDKYDVFKKRMNYIFDKKVNKLLNKKITAQLKKNDEYYYFDIFQERDNLTDNDFINNKLGHTCQEDYIKYMFTTLKKLLKGKLIKPSTVYGDTDSVFINYNIMDEKTYEKLVTQEALEIAIKLGVYTGELINFVLPHPQNLEYEKTFWPFCILTKKRYVGNLYELDPNKFKQKSMGIVLKRRDNAPIVKIVCGGIVKRILNDKSAEKAIDFLKVTLKDMLCNKFPLEKFIITKTLRAEYKNRGSIVQAVLADRMAARDPGNKPQSNDRIPYVFHVVDKKVKLQGERVEHPDYLIKHNLKLDYLFYITNQIMKPALQFLELLIENPGKVFEEYILREVNRRKGIKPITYLLKNTCNTNMNTFEKYLNDNSMINVGEKIKKKQNGKKKKKSMNIKNTYNLDDDGKIIINL
jgi:DNA polymerase elongation subunit (family B)